MSNALAKIWARKIHEGAHTIEEVESKFGSAGVKVVKEAYFYLYGEEI